MLAPEVHNIRRNRRGRDEWLVHPHGLFAVSLVLETTEWVLTGPALERQVVVHLGLQEPVEPFVSHA